jgi:hypothetical protein
MSTYSVLYIVAILMMCRYSSDPHRYLFLLFREPEGLNLSKADVGGEEFVDRRSFPAAEWTAKHGLELAGVNWMLGAGDGWSG